MQAELLSVENHNIWSAEALFTVEGKTNLIATVRWGWLHVVEELRHVCKFVSGTLGGLYSTPEFRSAKGRSIRTNVRNEEVRQPDSSDEAAEQRSPDSGGGSGAKRADRGGTQ